MNYIYPLIGFFFITTIEETTMYLNGMILSPRVHGLLLFSRNVQILLQNDIFNVYWSLYFISLFIDFDFFFTIYT